VKSGVIELSRLSGRPILPLGFGAFPRRVLQSWDRFVIPYPFGRAAYVWGAPLYVPPGASRAERARYQELLARQLDEVTAEADRIAEGKARPVARDP